ncbi:putative hemolysin [Paenibacillus phyllosphaerae]|uniref:Putative hemolysin n=1 Tax=Paenibacillus phyllosphaerae TaxID=274593 RepID=A0A7W5AZT3_9BACL|nr:hemolysin family protein [Paenibacillus phyllosphaerae]MBB3111802.1 putative hemolysin [Paenibacillus phyllosphaerae]
MSVEIVVLLLLIVLNAFFAASEIALISLNDTKIKTMAEAGHKKAKMLVHLLNEPSRFLATIQIGITLAGFLASAFAGESFAGVLATALFEAGVPLSIEVLETISLVIITLVLSYFTLVFGELVPKRLAMQKGEAIAMFAVTPLTLLLKVASPFVKLLTLSTNMTVRLFGVDPDANKEEVTEEEIRMMLDVGKESGAIQETEKRMINNIFEFDNKTVSDILTHRTSVISIPVTISLQELAVIAHEEKYSRLPVYEEHIDNIVGILHTKDLIPFIQQANSDEFDLKAIMRTPYFVPENKPIDELLKDLQTNKVHMAIAIDEYGGLAGIVTIEDLLEEIVGNIFDEHDEDNKEIERLDDATYIINGMVSLRTVNEVLGITLPVEEYDTLSGFIVGQLGSIPRKGDRPVIEFEGAVFQVEEVEAKRIGKIRASRVS